MESFEVNAAPLMNPEREARRAGLGRQETDHRLAAHRLRARGFSYRRIADTLRIGYGTVSRWLYSDAPSFRTPTSGARDLKAAELPDAHGGELPVSLTDRFALASASTAGHQASPTLELRVAMLEATLARLQREAVQREAALIAELDGLRDALAAAGGAGGSLNRLLRWSRGREPA